MEMLNATLLVQAVNFIIAYYLLRFFLLQPVSRVIHDELAEKNKKHEEIKQQNDAVIRQLDLKAREWEECRHTFQQHSPTPLHRPSIQGRSEIVRYDFSESAAAKMQEEVVQSIVSKVDHAA